MVSHDLSVVAALCADTAVIAWVVLVPAEMFGVSNGLGYAVLNARDNLDYERLAATMLLIGAIGFLLDRILGASDRSGRQGQGRHRLDPLRQPV
jgi:ABC-type nitrate/sulfonate/bicarbonate transport system permease component